MATNLGSTWSVGAAGINNSGVLWGGYAGNGLVVANGVKTSIANYTPVGVNASGTVAGSILVSGTVRGDPIIYHAGIYANGVITDYGTLGGTNSYATGINDAGVLVGYSQTTGNADWHAFSYGNGVMTDLSTLSGVGTSRAEAINSSGVIAGYAILSANSTYHACTWKGGVVTDLGTLGGSLSYAYGLNDAGVVVGTACLPGDSFVHAFSYANGVMTDLGSPLGGDSWAYQINSSGTSVGQSTNSGLPNVQSPTFEADVFRNGACTSLSSLVSSGWTGLPLVDAQAINEAGQIVAVTNSGGYLLTPIPNPPGQTIVVAPVPSHTLGDAPFGLPVQTTSGLSPAISVVSGPASVSNGLITLTGAGTVVLEVDQPGNGTYAAAPPVRTTIDVAKGTPVVTWNQPQAIPVGSALSAAQLDASANVPGSFAYSPAAGAVLPGGYQTLSVVFTPADTTNYNTAMGTTQLLLIQITPQLTWSAPAPIPYGTALGGLQLDATANVPGTFSYNPGPGTVLAAGNHTLTATFTPVDGSTYASASATVNLTVTPDYQIAWPAPASITYGTPLSSVQLNAGTSIPGTFSYSSPAGTVLAVGNHLLTATFTPADTGVYSVKTASVTIYVAAQPLLYVTNIGSDTVTLVRADGTTSLYQSGFQQPNGIVTDTLGDIYVDNGELDGAGSLPGAVRPISVTTGLSVPVGLALDSAGNLFIANYGSGVITKAAPGGGQSVFASGFNQPVGLAVDSAGNLYVSTFGDNSIYRISGSGSISVVAQGLNQPGGMAFDTAGNLYVAISNDVVVDRIDRSGNVTTFASLGSGHEPLGLAFDGDGNLYCTDSTYNLVDVIRPSGAVSVFAGSLFSIPAFLAWIPPPKPAFVVQPTGVTAMIGQSVSLTAAATGLPSYQWSLNGTPIAGANQSTLVLANIQPSSAGSYSATAVNSSGSAQSTTATVVVGQAPAFGVQPSSVTVASGRSAVLAAPATGSPVPTYQWFFNGTAIPGATSAYLVVAATSTNAGSYSCQATSIAGTTTSARATLTADTTGTPGYLTNLSARGDVGLPPGDTGTGLLIGGFGITGTGSKNILVRGVGPGLASTFPSAFNASNTAANPALALFNSGDAQTASNDDWGGGASLTAVFRQTGAFSLQAASLDSALMTTIPASNVTAQVSANGANPGTGLVEIYDADGSSPPARLINLSARSFVGTGVHVLVGGFTIGGTDAETLLVRAIGPGLADTFGLQGVLAQPELQLFDGGGNLLMSDTGWAGDSSIASVASEVGAFPLNPAHADSAILVTLPPGGYTVMVSGADGGTGTALVELYDVP